MITITSRDNQYLKLARSLHSKKGRSISESFLVEGLRLCGEAVQSSLQLRLALIDVEADQRSYQLAALLEERGIPVYQLPTALFATISATEHSQGIAIIAALPKPVQLSSSGHCYALCDGIADPGNLGTIIRSAYAAGVSGLILGPGCADPYNPKTVRSAMGGLFHLPLVKTAHNEEALAIAQQLDLAILVTATDGLDIRQAESWLKQPHLWVLGSEANGVSSFWRERATASISLPMREGAESLNVATAATVLFYQSFFVK